MLSIPEFLQHQALLGSGYAGLVQVQGVLESGNVLVALSNDLGVNTDMVQPYFVNLSTASAQSTASILTFATQALQGHITRKTGQTFNDYLFTNGLKVSRDFATLSGLLGVTINAVNIE